MPPKAMNRRAEFERDMLPQRDYSLAENALWGGFINVRVDESQKAEFNAWHEANPDFVPLILSEMIECGMKVTLSYDAENVVWICSFTGRLVVERPERYVTTSRAGSMAEVIALACWKHVYLRRGLYNPYEKGAVPAWG